MKRILLSLLLAAAGTAAFAQALPPVTNGGFETWNGNVPTGWTTTDQLYLELLGFPTSTVTQSTADKRSGTAAAKLQNLVIGPASLPSLLILGNALDLATDQNYPGGMAYTARPAAFQFWYKFQGTPADTVQMVAVLTRGGGTARQEIGGGAQVLLPSTSTSYRLGQLPMGYAANTLAPDSLFVLIATNGGSAGASFIIDDIVPTNTVTAAQEPMLAGALLAYPNPSTDGQFKVRAERDHDIVAGTLTVTDATGRTVLRQPAVAAATVANGRPVDLRGQRAGMYVLRLESERGAVVRRLMVN
ncbi:T9SS type A sorting domain-containing protein [Hymenobacter sp. CRA2]|uniref:T9SS type A sorting domain-containing protein n=1 Tax=Hymenobacter sp. CRA2 TaxID=1955620 RepID=UPI0009D2712B|nr:T9SS type A sorting domain-containing protein [Hymenobacter sp. CRA2]OON69639.1 hypothetical protein B0919_06800 [Hymenobacter sp. CRA2]